MLCLDDTIAKDEMPEGDGVSKETLQRILRLESRQGFADTAVSGGLGPFVRRHLPELFSLVADYESADHFGRQRAVSQLRAALLDGKPNLPELSPNETGDPSILARSISDAKGVGPKRAEMLRKLGLRTIEDLLSYLPRRLEDRSRFKTIGDLRAGDQVCVRAEVLAISRFRVHRRMDAVKVALGDGTGLCYGVWFNQPWIERQLKKGVTIVAFGKVERNYGETQLLSPVWEPDGENVETGRWVPVYPATEGANDRFLRKTIRRNLEVYGRHITSLLPKEVLTRHALLPKANAIRAIHQPPDPEAFESARRSLAFEEMFLLQIGLARAIERHEGASHVASGDLPTSFLAALPFPLTGDQRSALSEIVDDLSSPRRMMRLLQGEVGSGKTLVAIAAALHAVEAGYQVALMVPTELLAEQHAAAIEELLHGLPVTVALLSGSASSAREIRERIASGQAHLVIGTHALIQEAVAFRRLGLVVIDEQHRFGVVQRSAIEEKGQQVDLLVMSATPIPRTLALTFYGEFDVSLIEELPNGKRDLRTAWLATARRDEVYRQVEKALDDGGQGYVILPLVETSEKLDLHAATQVAEELSRRFPQHRVGLVHGRLSSAERAETMEHFRSGAIRLLVATTVIEVGIDVADANVMVIEHAERFGLSQLHQLRGRIGRSGQPAVCYALATPSTEEARKRLEAFASTDDGFALAEKDLCIRGPGNLLGTKQHGFLACLRAVDLLKDLDLMESSRRAAREALADGTDSDLVAAVERRFGDLLRWLQV